jgi:hypothetical protein
MPSHNHAQFIDEFRTHRGQVSGHDGRLVLLTTAERTTGTPRTTPVSYLPSGGDALVVIACPDDTASQPG